MRWVYDEDNQPIRITVIEEPRRDYVLYHKIQPDWPRCSAEPEAECNLHEHPGVVECCVHETFRCNRCEKTHSWDFGAADEAPGLCDDCWAVYFGTSDHIAEPTGVEP